MLSLNLKPHNKWKIILIIAIFNPLYANDLHDAIPNPKILILAGTDAIAGGIFEDSPAIDRSFLDDKFVDLYVPGNPVHPLSFINGILELTRKIK